MNLSVDEALEGDDLEGIAGSSLPAVKVLELPSEKTEA